MSETKGFDLEKVISEDAERKIRKQKTHKEITFKDYLALLKNDPKIAQNSPARLLEKILNFGKEPVPESEQWFADDNGSPIDIRYAAFSKKLFGLDKPIYQAVNFLKAGANRLETGNQILLLVGPTAGGKSTFARMLKQLLEDYSLRQVFAIKGCPMHEEPLHILPRYLRSDFERDLKVRIDGDLCPHCRHILDEKYTIKEGEEKGKVRWWDVPVETFTFSIQGARGIGSFEPSDEKSQDVTELVGRENISISSTKGPDHPLAWSLSGELEKANRGICEGRELIKADEKLLWVFISVAQEKEVKLQGSSFPHLSVDTIVIGHTNLTEYNKFSSRQENEALHDRMYVVQFPYPLRMSDEVKIYKKLIEEESDFVHLSKCHIAPGSLELAALFAVLTRLLPRSKGEVDILTKAKIYNGDRLLLEFRDKDKKPIDIRTLVEEGQESPDVSKREGMFGASSRDILAAINMELVKKGDGCLTPLSVTRALRDVFEHRMGYTPEEQARFREIIQESVMAEYKEFVIESVNKAFLRAYDDLARELFARYIEAVELHRNQRRKLVRGGFKVERDDITQKPKEPDLKLMRSIEEHIPVGESEADTFRGEILEYKSQMKSFNYDTYQPLARAVEKKLLADNKTSLGLVLSQDKPKGEEEKKRADDLFGALTDPNGARFCPVCAKEVVEKAREFLNA